MKPRNALYLVLVAGLIVAAPARAQVVRTFVSTSGVDNPDCFLFTPCRTFSAAIAAVSAGGEVVALDSGGYGPFTVDKSVTVLAPAGVYAAIAAPHSTDGVKVTANTNDAVVLRGLHIYGTEHTSSGVDFSSGRDLFIERCTITGFRYGIRFERSESWGQLFVNDTVVRDNGLAEGSAGSGLSVTTAIQSGSFVSIDGSIFTANWEGISAGVNARVATSNTLIAANESAGMVVNGADVTADRTTFAIQEDGLRSAAGGSVTRVRRSAFANHGTAIEVSSGTCYSLRDNFPGFLSPTTGTITTLTGQ